MPDVSYGVRIDGNAASEDILQRIYRLELEEHADMADMVRLELAVGVRSDGGGWTVIDDEMFKAGTQLQIEIVIDGRPPSLVIDAYVIETHVTFSGEPGESRLEVIAMDATTRMDREEIVRAWEGMSDAEIAREIFSTYDLSPDVDRTQPGERELQAPVIQRGTDAQFLRQLARRNGYVFYVETDPGSGTGEGHFHPRRLEENEQEALLVSMGSGANVESLELRYEMDRPMTAGANGLTVESQDEQSVDIRESETALMGTEATVNGESRKRLLARTNQTRTGELQTYAQGVVDRSAFAITAEGRLRTVVYGDVLRAKRAVTVRGAGRRNSGWYYVERVLHLITGESYTQEFTLRRNALGRE